MKSSTFLLTGLLLSLLPFLHSEQPGEPGFGQQRSRMQPEGGPGGKRPPPPPQVIRYLNQLKESDPGKYETLQRMREEDPQAFREELRKNAWGRKRDGEKGRGPKRHPLETEIEKIQMAETPEEREKAIQELREKVSERIEKNLQEREEAIEKIRKKLKQLEEQNQQERIRSEEIIDHHLQRILENLTPTPQE